MKDELFVLVDEIKISIDELGEYIDNTHSFKDLPKDDLKQKLSELFYAAQLKQALERAFAPYQSFYIKLREKQ